MDGRQWFTAAAAGLHELLPHLADHLDGPGLGNWSVRDLLGHTVRAFVTVESYLEVGADSDATVEVTSPAAYYRAVADVDPAQIEERGRLAGKDLGDAPILAAARMVERGLAVVGSAPDDAILLSAAGAIMLADYLPTRAFEVSVHSIDLARATGQSIPSATLSTLEDCLGLVTRVASESQRVDLLLASTGRGATAGLDVLGAHRHRHAGAFLESLGADPTWLHELEERRDDAPGDDPWEAA